MRNRTSAELKWELDFIGLKLLVSKAFNGAYSEGSDRFYCVCPCDYEYSEDKDLVCMDSDDSEIEIPNPCIKCVRRGLCKMDCEKNQVLNDVIQALNNARTMRETRMMVTIA